MQSAKISEPSMAHVTNGDRRNGEHLKDEANPINVSNNAANSDCGINGNDDNSDSSAERSVSIAYADGPRQPALHNMANLFHLGVQSFNAFAEDLLYGTSKDSSGDDNDDTTGKTRQISCFCLPCISCGRGEEGRSTVRLMSTLFFPLFLLSFFLLDDVGRIMVRNMRLRNGSYSAKTMGNGVDHPVIRRKIVHSYPGLKRELLWVPLERTVTVDEHTALDAKMKCPKAVLFFFHGCSRYAASFFYSPQGRRMVSAAYRAGIAVVAFEKNDEQGCWDWEDDGAAVLKVGRKFLSSRLVGACGKNAKDQEDQDIYPPIWAFGASSGGSFVAMLAAKMKEDPKKFAPFNFSAINVQIMSPPEELDWDIPTIFTVMDGDTQTKERVQNRVSKKFQKGPFKMITTSGQKGIHPDHFSKVFQDDEQMTPEISNNIHQSLVIMGIIDPSNDHLLVNPRQKEEVVASIWQKQNKAVKKVSNDAKTYPFGVSKQMARPLRKPELKDAHSIWLIEELNVAFDQHEITSEGFGDVLEFFFKYGVP
mmetsp:Transcript_31193/g.67436  ORF Transcript_31193/g.67436 Transcript_31193/m.67436 type:complete len:535 (+) Transcript_31193:167-1771(+)